MGKISKQLILGLVSDLKLAAVKPFFLSLEKSGYHGDLGLFTSGLDAATMDFLRARRANLIPFGKEYLKPNRVKLAALARPFVRARRFDRLKERLGAGYLHPNCARHIYYQKYLAEHGAGYNAVMLADIRDILFQKDPFDFSLPDGLGVFREDASQTIGTCSANSYRTRAGFGPDVLQLLHDKHIYCAGTIFGTPAAIRDYCARALPIFYACATSETVDQATFNYLLHLKPPPRVHHFDNDAGPVLTMGHVTRAQLRFNAAGQLVNPAGRIFNTLHQYDRHPELAAKLIPLLT